MVWTIIKNNYQTKKSWIRLSLDDVREDTPNAEHSILDTNWANKKLLTWTLHIKFQIQTVVYNLKLYGQSANVSCNDSCNRGGNYTEVMTM